MTSAIIDTKRRVILGVAEPRGYFKVKGLGAVRNKFTRNMGYIIDGLLRDANVTVYDTAGTGRTAYTSYGGLIYSSTTHNTMGSPVYFQYGIGVTPPTVTDNKLVTPDISLPTSVIYISEEDNTTSLVIGSKWSPSVNKSYSEAGLFWLLDTSNNYNTMLARTVFPATVVRTAFTEYFEGYQLSFPATFTRWFVRALFSCMIGNYRILTFSLPARNIAGAWYVVRSGDTFAGAPDVMIGGSNDPASPTMYNLVSPIASLGSQSQSVEIDTSVQEVRIVRTGTYTPTTDTTLGEVGLFADIQGFIDGTAAGRRTMLVRVPLPEPVTIRSGTTYTLGIVIRLP